MVESREKSLWRILFGSILLSSFLAILDLRNIALDLGFSFAQTKWLLLLIVIGAIGFFAGLLFSLTWTVIFQKLEASVDAFLSHGEKLKWPLFALFFAALGILPLLALNPFLGNLLGNRLWVKIFIFLLLSLFGASLLRTSFSLSWRESLAYATLGQLLVYQLVMASLYITDFPFAIGWTRDSRYYYASLFFSERIYGQELPLPILHPTLHFIFSIPFLIGKLPLWAHRAWSVILTLGLTWVLVSSQVKKTRENLLNQRHPRSILLFTIWAFLFLTTGSIYAHLLIPALIIISFVSPEKKWQSWIAVIIASLWAGMSRINWFPVPGMLAALIYLLEVKLPRETNIFRYLLLPMSWFFIGIASAFFSQTAYIHLSGNGTREEFFTSLSSDLLWYRLLPNNTFAPGILWGAVFLSAPLILFVIWYLNRQRGSWHPLRLWGIFSAIAVLFVGGLVVSVKIGGGADLHNMDAYFVSILLVGSTLFLRRFQPDTASENLPGEMPIPLFALGIFSLAWFILRVGGSVGYDRGAVDAALRDIQAQATSVAASGEDILFISQRHLLAVGLIEDIPLVPDYEKDVLMEMAMSRNRPYLDGFYDDLRHQEFGLIVIDPQSNTLISEKRSFGAENNIWIFKVTRPLLCYYEPLILYANVGVELYTPRAEPLECD